MCIAFTFSALHACCRNSKCRCGEAEVGGQEEPYCDLEDDTRVPEYKYSTCEWHGVWHGAGFCACRVLRILLPFFVSMPPFSRLLDAFCALNIHDDEAASRLPLSLPHNLRSSHSMDAPFFSLFERKSLSAPLSPIDQLLWRLASALRHRRIRLYLRHRR